MKIAVTGGVGFIGSNFIAYFCSAHPEHHVLNIDRMTYAANPATLQYLSKWKNHSFLKLDIRDSHIFEAIEGCDAVVHFAAETHVDRSMLDSSAFLKTDILGTYNLLEAARKVGIKRFIHISTDEVYGSITSGSYDESSPLNPTNPYAVSKAAADLLVLSYVKCYEIPAIILRFSNNYGPFQHPEKFIPLFITNLMEGRRVPVYGDGLQIRDWLFVEDTARAVELVLEKGAPGEIYNVSAHQERTNLEVTRSILKLCGRGEDFIVHVPDRIAHDRRYSLVSAKIEALGFSARHNFEEGIAKTVAWYRENQQWWKAIRNSDEFLDYYRKKYPGL